MLEIKRKEEASKSEKQVGGNNRNVFLIVSGGERGWEGRVSNYLLEVAFTSYE